MDKCVKYILDIINVIIKKEYLVKIYIRRNHFKIK